MRWLLDRPWRTFWAVFALMMTPALWAMRPPWNTRGWSAPELIGAAAIALLSQAVFAALMAGFLVMIMRGVHTWPERGK